METDKFKIVQYQDKYEDDYKKICYEWLNDYDILEEMDVYIIENHKKEVLEKGGYILFAIYHDKAVGTVSLIRTNDTEFELVKLGVLKAYRGNNFGEHLLQAAIDLVRKVGGKKITLSTMSMLTYAIELYKRVGFKEIPYDEADRYEMSDRMFQIEL